MTLFIDLTAPVHPILSGHLRMGGTNPQGVEINANSRCLTLGGRPWLPVMGEFHFSRYARAAWRDELLKMKAGGIQVAATYLFWNHHEEIQGRFRWDGNRDLRAFVALCAELGLYSYPRIGPWAHGEARLGGFPDWLAAQCPRTRQDDPRYLAFVRIYYAEIAAQLDGLLWKQGGPIVGIQLENELLDQPEHLRTLKRMAREAGLDVPIYTMTGWGPAQVPEDELIPVFGGYPDAPWDRYVHEWARASRKHFFFAHIRDDNAIGADLLRAPSAPNLDYLARYPFGTCEMGGGMQVTYHRRPRVDPRDAPVMALCKLGSGAILLGYYMYHGGTHPLGELSTLQESQETGYWNDLPVRNYDFQAPLGEDGQVREHYHRLRLLHLFLQNFGSELAAMPSVLPAAQPSGLDDTQTPRWAVRSDGESGYLFMNNYQRIEALPALRGVQFELELKAGRLLVPAQPADLPAGFSAFWPFGLHIGAARLRYATAQPVCQLNVDGLPVWVFAAAAGVPAEFAFEDGAAISGEQPLGGGVYVLRPGREHSYLVVAAGKPAARIVVLAETKSLSPQPPFLRKGGENQEIRGVFAPQGQKLPSSSFSPPQNGEGLGVGSALQLWKLKLWGRERLVLSPAALFADDGRLHLRSEQPADLWFGVYPAPDGSLAEGGALLPAETEGLFSFYHVRRAETRVPLAVRKISAAGPARAVPLGAAGVAQAPGDADFERAEVWQVDVTGGVPDLAGISAVRLRIDYRADAARALCAGELVADDFYFGAPWEIGLNRLGPPVYRQGLRLQFLPLPAGAPIYLPAVAPQAGDLLEVRDIRAAVEYEAVIDLI